MLIQAYHGSCNPPFTEFNLMKCGTGVVGSQYKGTMFFTTSLQNAEFYTDYNGHIALWEIELENPLIVEGVNYGVVHSCPERYPLIEERDGHACLKHDGVICKDVIDGICASDVIVIWNPEQVRRMKVVMMYDNKGNEIPPDSPLWKGLDIPAPFTIVA